jgi:hypothetical protein
MRRVGPHPPHKRKGPPTATARHNLSGGLIRRETTR